MPLPLHDPNQAAFGFFTIPTLLPCANCSSSSPFRTAVIRVSITDDSLSSDGTAIAALPFFELDGF